MDFRLSRLSQEKTAQFRRGENLTKERDYSKQNISWKEGSVVENLKILGDFSQITQLIGRQRNLLELIIKDHRNVVEAGAWYSNIFPSLIDWKDYALATGIISQIGNGIEPNDIPKNKIRICWFADINQKELEQKTISERWDEFSVGSIISNNTLKIGDFAFEISESSYSEEFIETHLSYVDVDTTNGNIEVVYQDDRNISEPWYGYIPPYAGGKPSALSPVNGIHRLRATIPPYDLKKIRKLKMKELIEIESKYDTTFNKSFHFEYIKNIGSIIGVSE